MMDKAISVEYILYACDDDIDLAEKICRRLNGVRIMPSIKQFNRLKTQRLLLKGKTVPEIAKELDMAKDTIYAIRKTMIRDGLVYYTGEDND